MGEIRCCRNRTKLEIVLLILLIIAFILLLLHGTSTLHQPYSDDVCTAEICLKASQKFLNFIDKSVNPCDNFYEFACGNFIKNYAEIYGVSTPIEEYQLKASKKLLRVAEDPPNLINDSKSLLIAKKLYRKCVTDNPSIKERDDLILNLITQIGGWPMVQSNWNDSNFIWINMVLKARNLGLKYNWFLEITEDMGVPKISFPEYLRDISKNYRKYYQFLIAEVGRYFGTPSSAAWLDAEEILHFQQNLIRIASENRRNRQHRQPVKKDEFINKYHDFDWIDLISNITRMNRTSFDNSNIFIKVIYYDEFYRLLQNTPARVQANYFVWKTIEDFYPFLSSPLQGIFNNFLLLKDRKLKERAELCLQFIRIRMKNVLEGAFIHQNVINNLTEKITYLIDSIKNKMIDRILASKWMDNSSQTNAIQKIKNIRSVIEGDGYLFQADAFDQYYGLDKFEWGASNNTIYMVNELQLNYYRAKFEHIYVMANGNFAKPIEWDTINAGYLFSENRIALTPMIFGSDFYDDNYPQSLNYGGFGTLIAHELAHSLDTRFPHITENGTKFWISLESKEILLEKLNCTSSEYDRLMGNYSWNYSEDDEGDLLSENSADFLGLDFAYEAYQDAIKIVGTDKVLPFVNFKPNQLFWLQHASYLCYKKIQMSSVDLENDFHSLPEFRVIGPVRNSKYFAEVFHCNDGTKMNPPDKCELI